MKKWWQKTPGELWINLFVREKTRWLAVVPFLCITAIVNWMVVDAALEGRTSSWYGISTVSHQSEPRSFLFWVTWRTTFAVVLDLLLLGALLAAWKGRKKAPIQPPQSTPLTRRG